MGSKSWARGLTTVATGARVWNIPAVPSCNQGPKTACETLTVIANPLQMHIPYWLWFRKLPEKHDLLGVWTSG